MIRIEWDGLSEFEYLLGAIDEEFERIVKEEYNKYGLLVEEGAKALAPKDEGDLEESINFQPAKKVAEGIMIEGGSNLAYALVRHEAPYRSGSYPKYDNGAKFPDYYKNGRGLRTRAKGNWRGYPSGRKYLENAVKATEGDFNATNERIIDRVLRGR